MKKEGVKKKRRRILVERGFQFRYTTLVIILMIVYGAVLSWLVYYFTWSAALRAVSPGFSRPALNELFTRLNYSLLITVLCALLMGALVGFLTSLYFSHRVAGPLYRIKKVAREATEGNPVEEIRIRKKDELKDVVNEVNLLLKLIRELKEKNEELYSLVEKFKKEGK